MAADEPPKSPMERFALSFKAYAIALGIIVASVPIASRAFELLPEYESLESVLTFFTSLASYLGVALVFSLRRKIGNAIFPAGSRVLTRSQMLRRRIWQLYIPCCLIAISVLSLVGYLRIMEHSATHAALQQSYTEDGESLWDYLTRQKLEPGSVYLRATVEGRLFKDDGAMITGERIVTGSTDSNSEKYVARLGSENDLTTVLRNTPALGIPFRTVLEVGYVLMFVSAAMAFVWFGVIEYVQGVLELEDQDLMIHPYRMASYIKFPIEDVHDKSDEPTPIFFELSYNRDDPSSGLIGQPSGPYCGKHGIQLEYAGEHTLEDGRNFHLWNCSRKVDKKIEVHILMLKFSDLALLQKRSQEAKKLLGQLVAGSKPEAEK